MEELEKPYIQALVQHCKPEGNVLEIGFCEPSILEMQHFKPNSHTVIEGNSSLAAKAKKLHNLILIEGDWKKESENLGEFDVIIINGYPNASSSNQKISLTDLQHARGLLEEEKKIAKMVAETVPNLSSIKYTDEDLDAFFAEVDKESGEGVVPFLENLVKSGQISTVQYTNCLEKHDLMKEKRTINSFWKYPNYFLEFLSLFTAKNLKKGGRLFCYIDKNSSKYDDPKFFNHIITNPALIYEETTIKIDTYEALIMRIQKKL